MMRGILGICVKLTHHFRAFQVSPGLKSVDQFAGIQQSAMMEHMLFRRSCSYAMRSSFIPRANSAATRLKLPLLDLVTAQARVRDALPTDVTQMLEVDRECFPANLQSTQQSLQVPVDATPHQSPLPQMPGLLSAVRGADDRALCRTPCSETTVWSWWRSLHTIW